MDDTQVKLIRLESDMSYMKDMIKKLNIMTDQLLNEFRPYMISSENFKRHMDVDDHRNNSIRIVREYNNSEEGKNQLEDKITSILKSEKFKSFLKEELKDYSNEKKTKIYEWFIMLVTGGTITYFIKEFLGRN